MGPYILQDFHNIQGKTLRQSSEKGYGSPQEKATAVLRKRLRQSSGKGYGSPQKKATAVLRKRLRQSSGKGYGSPQKKATAVLRKPFSQEHVNTTDILGGIMHDFGAANTHYEGTGEVEAYLHSFLTSTLDRGEWSASRPGSFTLDATCTSVHSVLRPAGPRVGLDAFQKTRIFCCCQESNQIP
jgi:hypothetical protein